MHNQTTGPRIVRFTLTPELRAGMEKAAQLQAVTVMTSGEWLAMRRGFQMAGGDVFTLDSRMVADSAVFEVEIA